MLELIVPRRCAVCSRLGADLCAACRGALRAVPAPLCARCGAPTVWPVERCAECAGRRLSFASARAAVLYDDGARRLVQAWKERGLRRLAGVAGELTAAAVPRPRVDALAFVPADPDRGLARGHAPAAALARELGRRWGLPVEALVRRTAALPRQRGLGLAERRRNVRDAFAPAGTAPARVCVVDDVYTSGATANACAAALRKAGARRVEVVSFARAVR